MKPSTKGSLLISTGSLRIQPKCKVIDSEGHEHPSTARLIDRGRREYLDLSPGDYQLQFKAHQEGSLVKSPFSSSTVTIEPGQRCDFTLDATPGYQMLRGRVSIDGQPLTKVDLQFALPGKVGKKATTRVGSKGQFQVMLPIGLTFDVSFRDSKGGTHTQTVHVGRQGEPWQIDFPATEVLLDLRDVDGNPILPLTGSNAYFRLHGIETPRNIAATTVRSGASGPIRFGRVTPGRYKLHLPMSDKGFPYRTLEPAEIEVFDSGEPQTFEVIMQATVPVQGSLVDSDWPDDETAYVCAWADSQGKKLLSYQHLKPIPDSKIELWVPPSTIIWVSVERGPWKHEATAPITGPIPIGPEGKTGIQLAGRWPN